MPDVESAPEPPAPVALKKPRRPAASVVNLMMLAMLALAGHQLFLRCQAKQVQYEAKLAQVARARQENHRMQEHNRQLHAMVDYLKTDAGVEQVARNQLGLIKPGEVAYEVIPPPPTRTIYRVTVPRDPAPEKPGLLQRVLQDLFSR